jgi:hypothetical protein
MVITFLVNWILVILLLERTLKKIKPILDKDKASGFDKYDAFHRLDSNWLNRPWLYMNVWTLTIRLVLVYVWLNILGLHCHIMAIGFKHGERVRGVRLFFTKIGNYICSKFILYFTAN